jgi:hypothetical protein
MVNVRLKYKSEKMVFGKLDCKNWCFQTFIDNEVVKDSELDSGSIEREWIKSREAIKYEAKNVFCFQKARKVKRHGSRRRR